MKIRRGYSLVECLATFALMGVAMTAVAVSMSGMRRAWRQTGEDAACEMALQRFAARFRIDAHEAASAQLELPEEEGTNARGVLLRLGEGESVRYTIEETAILREQLRGADLLHRDRFRLPDACKPGWRREDAGPTAVVVLELEPQSTNRNGAAAGPPLEIRAAVGLLPRAAAGKE